MDSDDLHDLACVFLQSGPGMATALREAAAAGDRVQVRFLTHRLAGTLGFFDERAASVAGRLELALVEGGPPDLVDAVDALDREVARVVGVLEGRARAVPTVPPPGTRGRVS